MTDPNKNRHLSYYLTSPQGSAPAIIFQQYEEARDFLNKSKLRGYVMNTCWGYTTEGYQAEKENSEDHAKERSCDF